MQSSEGETDSILNANSEERLDDISKEVQDDAEVLSCWKRIFHLPYEPVWFYAVMAFGILDIYTSMYEACFKKYDSKTSELNINRQFSSLLYLVDILITIGGMTIRNLHIPPGKMILPKWIVLLDFLSLWPLHHLVSKTRENARLYYRIQAVNVLKIFRVHYFFNYQRNLVGNSKFLLHFAEIFFNSGLVITTGYFIIYQFYCPAMECGVPLLWDKFMYINFLSISIITGAGNVEGPYHILGTFFFSLLSLLFFFIVTCASMCYITIEIFCKRKNMYIFLSKMQLLNETMVKLKVPKMLAVKSQNYYRTLFENRNGNLDNFSNFTNLPSATCDQVGLEIFWSMFKHSSIFRDCDLSFLRFVTYFVKSKIMLPGDNVFEYRREKSHLVYVVSGVIQFISEEDGLTPILSFSGGTCLGDSGLFISCKSSVKVTCKTFCNIYTIDKKTFTKAAMKVYPERYKELRQKIIKRISDARRHNLMSKYFNGVDELNNKTDLITILWLKSTLHRLMIKGEDSLSKHECQNIFLRDQYKKERFKNKYFIGDYLDTLVISERLELVTDTVFLKTTCPCILQPDSVVLHSWNLIIMILSTIAACVIPFYAFLQHEVTLTYIMFIYVLKIFWWLDLYIITSTAIKTSYETISNIEDIFYYRLQTIDFLLDIASAFPLDFLSCILLWTYNDQNYARLHLNMILKIYRIQKLFKKMETTKNDIIVVNYMAIVAFLVYFSYFFSCLLIAIKCHINPCPAKVDILDLLNHALVVLQTISQTSTSSKFAGEAMYFPMYIFISIVSIIVYALCYAFISANHMLRRLNKISLLDTYSDIFNILEYHNLTLKYKQKIIDYIDTQWYDNKAVTILYNVSAFVDLPRQTLYKSIKEETYRETLLSMPLFCNLPAEVIADISVIATPYILPPNQIVFYRGEVPNNFYILSKGYCKAIQNITNKSTKQYKPPEGLAIIEACLRLPIQNTLVTVTHCRSLYIDFSELMKLLLKYPEVRSNLLSTINQTAVDLILYRNSIEFTKDALAAVNETTASKPFHHFEFNSKVDSVEQYYYEKLFDDLNFFYCIKYLLMRVTISPHSKFLYYWECVRCVCAFTSAAMFSDNEISTCINCVSFIFLNLLDVMAWADIYLRLHVAYYNKKNCLVTHPLKTATHYIKSSFVIDLIGVFPFSFIVYLINSSYYKLIVILQMNRLLQMHRFLGFFRRLDNANLKRKQLFLVVIKFLPIIIVCCVVVGSLLRWSVCDLKENQLMSAATCATNSWIHVNSFTKPLSQNHIHLYSIYIASVIFTQSGMPGFVLINSKTIILVILVTIAAYILSTHIVGKAIAELSSTDSTLIVYQGSVKAVNEFLNDFRVDPELVKQLNIHFELTWSRKKGKNIHEIVKHFHCALKQDILFDIYGAALLKVYVFGHESTDFLRNLLLEIAHHIALKDTYICTVNDINTDIYFVFKGHVVALAPDGTVLATLGPGSMFGTLDNCKISRQTIGVLAKVHADVLTISSAKFFEIVKRYPKLYHNYLSLTAVHVDYLEGRGDLQMDQTAYNFENKYSFFSNPMMFISNVTFNPKGTFTRVWNLFSLLILCTLEVLFTMYQIAVKEFGMNFVIIQYCCDAATFFNFYIKSHLAFENEVGIMITDLKLIYRHFRYKNIRFYILVISSIPLDVFAWLLPVGYFYKAHAILRCNRILKFYFTVCFFREQQETLNCKLYIRCLYIGLWTSFILILSTATFIVNGCSSEYNTIPKMECNFYAMSSYEKLLQFISYYNVFSLMYSLSYQIKIIPVSSELINHCIYMLIILSLVRIVVTAQVFIAIEILCAKKNTFNTCINRYMSYLKSHRVTMSLVEKASRSLSLLWKYHRGNAFPHLLEEAPKLMREQILNSAFAHHINKHYVFEKCHVDFNRQLVAFLRSSTFFRHDYIVLQGSINNSMYFVHSGMVLVLAVDDAHHEVVVGTLKSGSAFGIFEGLSTRAPHKYSYRSITKSVILTLNYMQWKHLLKFFPASEEMILERYQEYRKSLSTPAS